MKYRKNIKRLTSDEKKRFVNAILALKSQDSVIHPGSQSRYDDFAETHMNAMMATVGWAHQDSVFFPWHRELLYQFEKLLQAVEPTVTIPYWDWTREQSIANAGFPFTNDFIAGDGTDTNNDKVERVDGGHPPAPYTYPFDPEAWSNTVVVTDGDGLNFFQRQFGERSDAPNLPGNDNVVTGVGSSFRSAIDSTNDYLTLRPMSESIHNLVHRWVGGNMLRMTSPNDPVFFMHHAQIDRMWSIWQKKVPSGTSLYEQLISNAGHKLNDAMIFNDVEPAPFTTGATIAQVIDGHGMHGDGVWYDSDIPEVNAPAPSLDFIDIPEGLTSYKAVSFRIKGGRQVHFRITGAPSGQFALTPMGTEFTALPVDREDFYYGYVWIQFTAVAGSIPNSSINIHAYIIDEEGYYTASEGQEYPLGDYTVTVTATTVARANNSVALVLDRSGSMSSPAGGTSTKSQLLQNAIGVFRDLMLANDEVSVTTFDDVMDTPIHMQTVSTAPAFSTVDLTPRNNTCIGGGIQQAAIELAAATHTNKAMMVLTDGNENVHPYIAELPSGTVTNKTYAIGFGLPGDVSDAVLNQITSNTHGDLIITGDLSSDEQRFNLTKYFVQMLAGITNSQIILDPNGKLYYGSKDIIPFKVTDADIYIDAIALCPIPRFLDFTLQTPGGTLIKPSNVQPNIDYILGQQVICYRITLPALPMDAVGSRNGTWNAILSLKNEKEISRLANTKEFARTAVSPAVRSFLPYSFIVHATSNLQFNAWKVQDSFKPGADVKIFASLKEYDVPMKSATVWAEIVEPNQTISIVKLAQINEGMYTGTCHTSTPGIYSFRIRTEGYSTSGIQFTREKTLIAGVYYGNYSVKPPIEPGDLTCDLLHCILEEHHVLNDNAIKRFMELGFDVKRFIECLEEVCPDLPKEKIPAIKYKLAERFILKPQLISNIKFEKLNLSKPIKMKPKNMTEMKKIAKLRQKKEVETMFTELDLEKELSLAKSKKSGKGRKQMTH